jgi:hypothetical protein
MTAIATRLSILRTPRSSPVRFSRSAAARGLVTELQAANKTFLIIGVSNGLGRIVEKRALAAGHHVVGTCLEGGASAAPRPWTPTTHRCTSCWALTRCA